VRAGNDPSLDGREIFLAIERTTCNQTAWSCVLFNVATAGPCCRRETPMGAVRSTRGRLVKGTTLAATKKPAAKPAAKPAGKPAAKPAKKK